MTGSPNRMMTFGADFKSGEEVSIPAKRFSFPACDECNSNYAGLEGEVKPVVVRMIEEGALTVGSLTRLLDWLDKVRVGLQHGMLRLHRRSEEVETSFFINDRVRQKDRFLVALRVPSCGRTLRIAGPATPLFITMPSCFAVMINELVLLNASVDFLVAENAGFPFARGGRRLGAGLAAYTPVRGTGILRSHLADLPAPGFGLWAVQVCVPSLDHLLDEWHRERSLPNSPGVSLPLIWQPGDETARFVADAEEDVLIPYVADDTRITWHGMGMLVLVLQNQLLRHLCALQQRPPNDFERKFASINEENYDLMHHQVTAGVPPWLAGDQEPEGG